MRAVPSASVDHRRRDPPGLDHPLGGAEGDAVDEDPLPQLERRRRVVRQAREVLGPVRERLPARRALGCVRRRARLNRVAGSARIPTTVTKATIAGERSSPSSSASAIRITSPNASTAPSDGQPARPVEVAVPGQLALSASSSFSVIRSQRPRQTSECLRDLVLHLAHRDLLAVEQLVEEREHLLLVGGRARRRAGRPSA